MIVEVVMPKMGESIQEGKILQWLKKEGETVERDEIILEISTDKVDTEVPAPNSGVLARILHHEDDTVEVGTVIAHLETDASAATAGASSAGATQEAAAAAPTAPPATPEPEVAVAEAEPAAETASADTGDLTDVVMPKMGESIQEGKVLQWLKKVGDKIERDEIILEISTDKVDTEVPSPVSGTLAEVLVQEDETVEVGTVIARIGSGVVSSGGGAKPASAPAPAAKAAAPAAPASNGQSALAAQQSNGAVRAAGGTTTIPRKHNSRFYSPLVRTIAEKEGVTLEELETIKGTGLDGRVTKHDLRGYMENRPAAAPAGAPAPKAQPQAAPAAAKAAPATSAPAREAAVQLEDEQIYRKYGQDVEIIPMDHIRQLISDHMVRSKQTSAHVTSVVEADVTDIMQYRNRIKDDFQKREGVKLTVTPFFCRALIEGVRAFPMVNVSVEGKKIVRHKHLNLGMATVLPDGNLIVPVIKDADALNITGLARSINDLATRARIRKLQPEEIQGGTITLTNVGGFGTLFGTPVINQPQTVIIGVGAVQKKPVVREVAGNDMILIRQMMYLSITYDHRVIDGALAGNTLATIKKSLESMNENTVQL